MSVLSHRRHARAERLADRYIRDQDLTAWLASLHAPAVEPTEPCSGCESTTYDGLLDDWGRCEDCLELLALDAHDGHDPLED